MAMLKRFKRKLSAPAKAGSAPGLIGLDIGAESIHLCQIRALDNGLFSVVAKASIDFPGSRDELLQSPRAFKKLVLPVLRERGFRGKKVVAAMPWDDIKIIMLTYKSTVTDVDTEVVRMLSNRIEGSIDDFVVDYIPVRSNPANEEHMVVATISRKDKVNTLLNALIGSGLEVDSLDIAPTALRRVVAALYSGEAAENVLMVHCYRDESYLTVISGRRLLFNQLVNFGETRLIAAIAKALVISEEAARDLVTRHGFDRNPKAGAFNMNPDGDVAATLREIVKPLFLELVNEINRVLVFTAAETHGVPVSQVCLLGSVAQWSGSQELLLSLLNFTASDDHTEFTQVFEDEYDDTQMPWEGLFSDISIAMGLALRGMVEYE